MIRLADANSMREMDRHAVEDFGISGAVLMENAARSVAEADCGTARRRSSG